MRKNITLIALALLAFAVPVIAAESVTQVYHQEDKAPALRFKNISSDDVEILLAAGDSATNSVTWRGTTTTINTLDFSGAGADTVSEIAASYLAVTNISGKKILEVDTYCSLSADSTDDELLDGQTITLRPGQTGEIVWDTSVALFYSTYVPNDAKTWAPSIGRKKITSINGGVGGTGNITVNIYKNGTEVHSDLIRSPLPEGDGSTNMTDTVSAARLLDYRNFEFGIGVGENTMIRAARATTATTGGLGAQVRQGE